MDANMQFRQCPNCGSSVNVNLPSCWSCGMIFYQQPTQQPQPMYYQQPQYNYNQQMQYQQTLYQQAPQYNYAVPIHKPINAELIGMFVALIGIILTIISMFLPYVSANILGYKEVVSIFDSTNDSYIILIVCLIDAFILLLRKNTYGIDTFATGGLSLFFVLFHLNHINTKIADAGEYTNFIHIGTGIYLWLVSTLLIFGGGITLWKSQKDKKNLQNIR